MTDSIPASEFVRNFGVYRMRAQREAVAVSSHGQVTGYFVSPEEFEAFQRYKAQRRSFLTRELEPDKIEAISKSRMHKRHDRLNALLDGKPAKTRRRAT